MAFLPTFVLFSAIFLQAADKWQKITVNADNAYLFLFSPFDIFKQNLSAKAQVLLRFINPISIYYFFKYFAKASAFDV
ncbi:hypothetical protein, partial [Vibrio navarrensis]